ncbi:hypothetical protein WA588_001404, partial [Blastocystis sp. NMH]
MPSAQQFVAPKWFSSLKQIVIGNGYCEDDRIVEIDGLGELESIVVGEGSFTYARTRSAVRKSKRADGTLRIVNCPKLKSIRIGCFSFSDFHFVELYNLPSLQTIHLGMDCFYNAPSFSLANMPSLESIIFDGYNFSNCHSVVFSDLPKLQSIELGALTFCGDCRNGRMTIQEKPYYSMNTLIMRDLPALSLFSGGMCCFCDIGSVVLKNIPQLSTVGTFFPNNSFQCTYSLTSSNAYTLSCV